MIRDDQQTPDDPEEELRRRIGGQLTGPDEPAAPPDQQLPMPEGPIWGEQHPTPPSPDPTPPEQPPPDSTPIGTNDPPWAPPPPPVGAGPIPTNPDGTQVGGGTPWNPGADHPSSSPPGYHWDPNLFMFQPDAPGGPPAGGGRPTGGNLTDPSYAARYVAWAGTQPGVNPSVIRDPGYWIGRFTSGAFGNDQEYALQRMMQAEGAPEGAVKPRATVTAPAPTGARTVSGPTSYQAPAASPMPQGIWNSEFTNQIRALIMARLQAAGQPVDPNDPNIASTMTAARDQATRSSDTERNQLAEHLYAQGGLNTDAIGQKIQQSGEKNALGLSSLRATLITRELQSKRDELKSLMQMAMQAGDAESARAIQMQLGELDAAVRREGLGVDMAKYQAYLNALASEQVMN